MVTRRIALISVGLLLCALAGCSSPGTSTPTDSLTVIQVVAAESVWAEVATQIGGPNVHVATLAATAADKKTVAGAQVLIVNGAGLDPWASEDAAANPGVGRVDVNVGDEVGVTPGSGDPYLWYDPNYVTSAAERIEAAFARLRPTDAQYFVQQEQAFERSSQATDEALAGTIKSRFSGTKVAACAGLASDVAADLGLKPQQRIAGSTKALLCDTKGDATMLQAASTAKIPVVSLSETLQPAGTTFQQWLTAQLQQVQQALSS
ncbi:MAG TPA: zinc ABC transporter substrate-binding protein [Actinospica sp.]|nr:zinc ABC transporter substrate-binding protein [Actinospica sp.]